LHCASPPDFNGIIIVCWQGQILDLYHPIRERGQTLVVISWFEAHLLINDPMMKRKSILQKSASIAGKLCFLLAVLCVVALYFKVNEIGMQHPISASLLASSFFFVFIGFVLFVIGSADIPSFKVVFSSENEEKK